MYKTKYNNPRDLEIHFIIEEINKYESGRAVLEVGCGESPMPRWIQEMGHSVTAIDYLPRQSYINFEFIQADFIQHKFDKKFDIIYSLSAIEHFGLEYYNFNKEIKYDYDEKCFEKVYDLLNDGGVFIFTVPYGDGRTVWSMKDGSHIFNDEINDVNHNSVGFGFRAYDVSLQAMLIDIGFYIYIDRFYRKIDKDKDSEFIECTVLEAAESTWNQFDKGLALFKCFKVK